MKEITKDNYKDLKFDGIVVRVPNKVLQNPYDNISFIFECAYYSNSKHGYPTKGDNPDESSFYSAWYNDDYLPRGLMFNSSSRFTLENTFKHWDVYNHYKFKDMEEFCTWYLQQKGREIWIDDGENKSLVHNIEATSSVNQNKEWIHEKCGTNTPPTSVPKQPSKGNKKSSLLDTNELKIDEISQCVLKHRIREELQEAIQKDKFKELNKINGESIYWDIYCEEETTSEMREKIEELYPQFKEQYAKSIKQYDGENLKMNPGWNTRRTQLRDVLKLLELRDLRQNTIDMLTEDMSPEKRCYLEKQLERDEKRIEDFLSEEV